LGTSRDELEALRGFVAEEAPEPPGGSSASSVSCRRSARRRELGFRCLGRRLADLDADDATPAPFDCPDRLGDGCGKVDGLDVEHNGLARLDDDPEPAKRCNRSGAGEDRLEANGQQVEHGESPETANLTAPHAPCPQERGEHRGHGERERQRDR
jgi:hypothetical protein